MSSFTALAVLATLAAAGDAVLLEFSSDACAPCRTMQPAVSRLVSDGYPIQRIDVDRHPETARQFGVRSLPTFVLLVNSREVGRIEGATSYDRLAELFRSSQSVRGSTPAAEPALHATDFRSSPEQAALAASVRLKVEDATGFGYGTGTIIDTHDDEALIVTCGHLFRESKGQGRIVVDLFVPGAQPIAGQLIAYDLDRDIALVSIRLPAKVTPVAVAPPGLAVRPRDRVFTIGCDEGHDATVRTSEITAVNKYRGKPNFTATGAPVNGRSGGGLFTADGQLIGVCNAADPQDDEGLYAGLASIHWQLDQIGQSAIYQRSGLRAEAAAETQLAVAPAPARQPLEASGPQLPAQMPPSAVPLALGDDTELVVIIRSKRNPQQRSEIYLVDQASPELLSGIVTAARRGAEDRAARIAAVQRSRQREHSPPPVVRAQLGEE